MEKKKIAKTILKSAAVALIPTMFFAVLALISPIGYSVQTRVYSVEKHYELMGTSDYVFAVVSYNCNASFDPMLYPLSWLFGRGYMSGNFSMIYLPYWMTLNTPQGEQYNMPIWGKQKEIENEATMKVVLEEFLINLPIIPAVFFAIELVGRRRLYLWFIGGTVGFIFGSLIGTIIGFFLVAFSTIILLPRLSHRGSRLEAEESRATET